MLIIDTAAAMARALALPLDPALRRFLVLRRDQLGDHLEGGAVFLVVEPGDTLARLEGLVGFPLALDGAPTWEHATAHPGGWTEVVLVLSDDGPAEVVLVPDRDTTDPAITDLLRRHGVPVHGPERTTAG